MPNWRVTISGELYTAERWVNTWCVTGSAITEASVVTAFDNAYAVDAAGGGYGFLRPCCGNAFGGGVIGVHMSDIAIQLIQSPPPVATHHAVSHNGGQNTPGGLPVDVSPVLSLQTAFAGRSFRGRVYLPPWHENQNIDTGGIFPQPDPTAMAGIAINAKKLADDLVAAGTPLAVYSRKLATANTVTTGYIDSNWDTQRRRSNRQPTSRVTFTV
jgi:hypothetical protein